MPVSACHQRVLDLKARIDKAALGELVVSAGAKGRQVTYTPAQINQMIALYNQYRKACPDALADPDLIELQPLDQPQGSRGRPAAYFGRSFV